MMELEKFDIDWLVHCYKVKCTLQRAEEHIRQDVCRLNSKLAYVFVSFLSVQNVPVIQSSRIFPFYSFKCICYKLAAMASVYIFENRQCLI